MKRYPEEITKFIQDNVTGKTTKELIELINTNFGIEYTEIQISSYKKNHQLKSGTPCGLPEGHASKQFPEYIRDFIIENHVGNGPKNMTEMINNHFGTSYTRQQLKSYYANHHISSGTNGRFQKGHIPFNKGKKGYYVPGAEKGWFKEGNTPQNIVAVGTEELRADGYIWRKIAEPNEWKQVHRILWEKVNGPIPKDCVITFLDGDTSNINLDNLQLITRAESLQLNRSKLRSNNSELTKTGILIAKVKVASFEKSKTKTEKIDHH